jgi:L-iditol 2-dehydrogenase
LLNGAYAELLVVPERIARVNLHPVPRSLQSELAALIEPLACALHATEGIETGTTVAVLGPGPMGIMLCACLRDAGATPVIMGGSPERRTLAQEFGAVPGDARDADIVIEATGKPKGWRDAVRAVDRGGTVILFGGVQGEVELDAEKLHYDEVAVRGAFHHTPSTVRAALAFLASGAYPWERLLTHEVPLDGLPALFAEPPDGYLKAVVRP